MSSTAEVQEDLLEGTAYRALRRLGAGGMGEVFEAEHRTLGKIVVVKVMHARFDDSPALVDRLRIEAQSLANLSSPHLVQVHDLGTTAAGRPYFVMERLEGANVSELVEARGVLDVPTTLTIAAQVVSALEVAHRAGIVHRDIKPDNVFVCDPESATPTVKVLDFGIAKVVGTGGPAPLAHPTDDGAVLGTPRYLSPEQAKGEPVDARADIYSVGLLIDFMLTGQPPFADVHDFLGLVQAHALRDMGPPSERAPQSVPASLDAVVVQATARSLDARYGSATDFADALATVHAEVRAGLQAQASAHAEKLARAEEPRSPGPVSPSQVSPGRVSMLGAALVVVAVLALTVVLTTVAHQAVTSDSKGVPN